MNNNLFNNELSDELKDITLCFACDDIDYFLNNSLKLMSSLITIRHCVTFCMSTMI